MPRTGTLHRIRTCKPLILSKGGIPSSLQQSIVWYGRRDSNSHCTVSKTDASYLLGYVRIDWSSLTESNRCKRGCNPPPKHSAKRTLLASTLGIEPSSPELTAPRLHQTSYVDMLEEGDGNDPQTLSGPTGLANRASTLLDHLPYWRKVEESNSRPSRDATGFKPACRPPQQYLPYLAAPAGFAPALHGFRGRHPAVRTQGIIWRGH